MANNRVQTTITAKDEASKVFKSLGTAIRGNVLAANLMATGITSAIGAASQAVGGLIDKFKESADLQLSNASAAGAFAALTGKSFTQGTEFVDRLNIKLGEVAAALPGATQDYKNLALGIQDNLIPAFKDASGAFNAKAFEEELITITRGMGVLGASANLASKDVSKFTAKFLGGSSVAELQNLLFAEANPAFLSLVEKRLAESGRKLQDLTVSERKEILKAVSQQLVTPEVIKASSGSINGLIESLKSNLFDPSNGVFGLMRDLDKKTKGNQTVLTAINEGLDLLIGENGLFNSIGKTLEALGIKFADPMLGLRNAILGFNKQVTYIRDWFAHLGEAVAFQDAGEQQNIIQGYMKRLQDWFAKTFDISQLGEGASTLLNNAISFLSKVDWSAIFSTIGIVVAKLFNELGEFITRIDFNNLLGLIGKIASGFIVGLGNFLANLDWATVLSAIGTVLAGIIISGIVSVSAAIIGSLGAIPIAVGAAIIGFISVVVAKWGEITNFFSQKWAAVQSAASSFIDWVKEGWNSLTQLAQDRWNGISAAANNLFNAVQNWFSNLTSRIPFVGGSSQPVANKATGNIPTTGILAAAVRESRQMPSGSNLVVANDSEMILNRSQQANLASNLQTRGGITFSTGPITIQTSATNAEEIADEFFTVFERRFNQFAQSRLAPTYAT